ncbi:MAG: hypothetical protein HY899_13505 [Deltaproteobacteria bacterium]|nr:hypothetical protein [Deltaproteobacteria bacterium]
MRSTLLRSAVAAPGNLAADTPPTASRTATDRTGARARIPTTTLVLALALSLAAVACGLRTAPRPAEDTAPVIDGSVETTIKGPAVIVRWARAERSADGRKLYDLAAFVVERSRDDGAFEPVATIDVVDQEKIRRRRKFEYRDENPGAGAFAYRVRAVCADGQEGPPTPAASVVVGGAAQ